MPKRINQVSWKIRVNDKGSGGSKMKPRSHVGMIDKRKQNDQAAISHGHLDRIEKQSGDLK